AERGGRGERKNVLSLRAAYRKESALNNVTFFGIINRLIYYNRKSCTFMDHKHSNHSSDSHDHHHDHHHSHQAEQQQNRNKEKALHGQEEAMPGHEHSGHAGHDKHAGHSTAGFLKRFIVSTIVSVPILVLSPMIQEWLGVEVAFKGDKYFLGLLATFVFIYGGWPFLKGLWDEVRSNAVGMMTLIGVAISAAWAYSFAVTLG